MALLSAPLAGCGQKGALVHPAVAKPAAAASAAPTP
ncbi:MAG: lipoprotein [Leptothrix sp. (in: b-proteobacteria)]